MTAGAVLDERNAEGVQVSILEAEVSWNPPAWTLHYEVSNTMQSAVWLVIDESVKVIEDGSRIELLLRPGKVAAVRMYSSYFDRRSFQSNREEGSRDESEISWPATLNDLWNAEREAAPEPGMYEVSVRVGYGTAAEPGPFQEETMSLKAPCCAGKWKR